MQQQATKQPKNRACISCGLIRSSDKFRKEGCPNCVFLQINKGRNFDACTTSSFKGQIYYTNIKKSWVAKWQRNSNCVEGFYAMVVDGDLPEDFIMRLEKNGIEYVSRNGQ